MATEIGTLAVRRSIMMQATPERVWQEFTSFEKMKAWFGIGHNLTAYEPRVGGEVVTEVDHGGNHLRFSGKIIEFEAGRELTFEADWEGIGWDAPPLITIRLTPALAGTLLLSAVGCSGIEKAAPRPRSARADAAFRITVPQIMRGTVASETILDGYRPVVVRGYGVVVGLNGTGSRDLPPDVRAHMIQEASRNGIGLESSGFGNVSPERFLDSMDTAVGVVEGLIPPGATEGTRFDVRVYAHPMTSTTSLEGGRLYTAELRPVVRRGLPPTGSRQAAAIARARGEVFINPFAEPGAVDRDTIQRKAGRILNGGIVTRDIILKLRLATPSHTGAEILQNAINARFPQEPTQHDLTARGESDEAIQITVPPSYQDQPQEFVQLLRHTTIRQAGTEQIANTIRRHVLENPADAIAATWRWQALGPRVLPVIRGLYDHPDERPRLAALQAGAKLDDALVVPHLIELTRSSSLETRQRSIELLARMDINPVIDQALRKLLDDDEVEVRLASYEALCQRRDPSIERFPVDDKFIVDVVPSQRPLIYITQTGVPRVALFGTQVAIRRPVTMTAWSQRFMIKADTADDLVEVYYRPPNAARGVIHRVEPDLPRFVRFLGHTTQVEHPRAGLGLSYSEVIGV
ncbi:MAG: flagellar basal body P-ring protein FlgI, partial [Planctomycetes bacterium]|nr:flagellar basal body P-ring protein FlgI [Planctomycetota bacterium]